MQDPSKYHTQDRSYLPLPALRCQRHHNRMIGTNFPEEIGASAFRLGHRGGELLASGIGRFGFIGELDGGSVGPDVAEFVAARACVRGMLGRSEWLTDRRIDVRLNIMHPARLTEALRALTTAIRQVEAAVEEMRAEHDPLASHIFASRRHYRGVSDTKSGKRREMTARLSYSKACDFGFRGSFDEWERLMAAVPRR